MVQGLGFVPGWTCSGDEGGRVEAENVLKWQKTWERFQTLPRQWIRA